MSETTDQDLSGVAETSLITLYLRAMESLRPDALIQDKKAVALVAQMSDEFARFEQIPMNDALKVMRNLATREYDLQARDFLARHPDAVVVHIGCGFDSRFERTCSMNGDSSTRLSRGWPTFAGCAPSRPRSGPRAFTTSASERR